MIREHASRGAIIALAVLALFWGYNWVVMKIALHDAAPFDFAALRTFGGALSMLVLLALLGQPLRPRYPWRTLLLGLLQTTGFVGLVNSALVDGHAGKSAILAYTMPFWVILLSRPLLGERIHGLRWVAVGLAALGLVLILEPWHNPPDLASSLLAVAAGVAWAAAVIVAKKIPVADRFELLSLTAWQMAFGCIPLIVIAQLVPSHPIHWTATFLAALAYNIIPANALAWLLWLYILQKLPANISGLSSLVIPVVGVVAAWIQLGEQPGLYEGAGMLAIVLALGVLTLAARLARPSRV